MCNEGEFFVFGNPEWRALTLDLSVPLQFNLQTEENVSLQDFTAKFNFRPDLAFCIGAEREVFISDKKGDLVPRAPELLRVLQKKNSGSDADLNAPKDASFTYELSACQIEGRTKPWHSTRDMEDELNALSDKLQASMHLIGCTPCYREVAPPGIPLAIYPDPTGRYQRITAQMSAKDLTAACSIIGTHIHIGMPDPNTAIKVYNKVIRHTKRFCMLGDNSEGRRLAIYREMNPDCMPPQFEDWEAYYDYAIKNNYIDDPRRCWTLVRISVHGTIEFRMFGATEWVSRIGHWGKECLSVCQEALI